MLNQKAFSLIELVLYLSIFAVFSLVSFSFLSNSYKGILLFQTKMKKEIRNSLAYDLLFRDFISADYSVKLWSKKKVSVTAIENIVFRKNLKEVGWSDRKDGLFRITGSHDFNKTKWTKKNSARINIEPQNLSLKMLLNKKKDNVVAVNIISDKKPVLFVKLRNGIINDKIK